MKKLLIAGLILLLAAPLNSQTPDVIANARKSLVAISLSPADELGKVDISCSGFVVAITRVMTAEHCLQNGAKDIYVDGRIAKIIRQDQELLYLETPILSKPPLKVRDSNPMVGEPVAAIGYAYGATPEGVFKRHVARVAEDSLYIDGPLIAGMSGGPVIDENGQVIGVTQGGTQVHSTLSDVNSIKKVMNGK